MRRTAVQWLVEKLEIFATEEEMNIIDQAKEMEKQQIIDAVVWFDDTSRRPYEIEIDVEQYYNETFKSE